MQHLKGCWKSMPKLKRLLHTKIMATPASPSPLPQFEVDYPDLGVGNLQSTLLVSQDDEDNNYSSPTANTCHQHKVQTIMQDFLFHMIDIPCLTQPFNNQQAASCKFPL